MSVKSNGRHSGLAQALPTTAEGTHLKTNAGFNGEVETEAIAIVGIGCRFPGGANSPESFWRLMRDGVDAITEVPAERWALPSFYDPKPVTPGKINTRWGGFLPQIDHFDANFFNISPREAVRMDPQQRLLLEVTWEALEDAGQVPEKLAGSQSGVFIGMIANEYEDLYFHDPNSVDVYVNTGCARSVASGRLSYALGLQGPSLTVDTACSSSLVAVHLACQSLRAGESELAIAGGVNLLLMPQPSIGWCQANNLAPDGRCKAFDARANGFIRSDGVGVVVLKPLSRALADGDAVYALIRGSAVNNDGRTSGLLMTPGQQGQEAMLVEAYRNAGVDPSQVQYIEAHGTGTKVGDPTEARALGAVLGANRSKEQPFAVGSVKTNIGHTEGAAGVAGLIKAALSLKHRAIPASLHCEQPNPEIPWDELPIFVQREFGRWPNESETAFAGVNSFGISGTNAHIVLQEAPPEALRDAPAEATERAQLLALSAQSSEALREMARRYIEFLDGDRDDTAAASYDLAYTAAVRRTHHDYRMSAVFRTREELAERFGAYLNDEVRAGLSADHVARGERSKLVFVLPGQGSQWVGMGRRLFAQEEVFRTTLEACEQALGRQVDWSLLEVLTSDAAQSRLNEIDVIQPALFAVQVALAAQWGAWGIRPDAVVGQSMGEVAAAYIAGALSLDDAAQVICRRSRLLKRMSGLGNMVVVDLSMEQAQQALSGYEDRLSIAVSNSPTSTVLAGNSSALDEVVARLQSRDVFCRPVKVDIASHSPQMEPLREELLAALEGLDSRAASIPLYSTVTGKLSDEGMRFQADYWWRNLREPVRFSAVVQQLLSSGHDLFLEISPHPILTGAIQQGMHHFGRGGGGALPSMRREEDERSVMLATLGALYTQGYGVEWSKLYPSPGRVVALPAYAWQGERFWLETAPPTRTRSMRSFAADEDGHPLLGQLKSDAHVSGVQTWETEIGAARVSYLYDHRVQGAAVLPAAAYLELALAAARETFGAGAHAVEGFSFKKALFLSEQGERTLQTVVAPEMPGTASCKIYSLADERRHGAAEWTLHAEGIFRVAHSEVDSSTPDGSEGVREGREELTARCREGIESADLYRVMHERGLEYGPNFQAVLSLQRGEREAVARLRVPPGAVSGETLYQVHPVLLDAGFQVLAALLPDTAKGETYLPVSIDSLTLYNSAAAEAWAHARLTDAAGTDESLITGDITLLNDEGNTILEARGLTLQRLEPEARRASEPELNELLYEVVWEAREISATGVDAGQMRAPEGAGGWLVFAEDKNPAEGIASLLRGRGESCHLVYPGVSFRESDEGTYEINPAAPAHYADLMRKLREGDASPRGVLYLWGQKSATTAEQNGAGRVAESNCERALLLVQALANTDWKGVAPRLWLVTRGTQAAGSNADPVLVAQAPLWGFGRVVASEHPEFRCTLVDLAATEAPDDASRLFDQLWVTQRADEVALRADGHYVSKLARYSPRAAARTSAAAKVPAGDQPFRMETSAPGMLEGLTLRAMTRRTPRAGQVEIEVEAAGLNFRDVMKALDIYPGLPAGPPPFGDECAGRVTAVGEGVEGFKVGDEVVAIADHCFATHVVADAELVWRRPRDLSAQVAAGIPIAFGTAAYALEHLGRMRRGERVLIHAAAGGVGLAAVQLAQRAGAEVFATAGSEEKRELLKSLGVKHVMDSRSLKFADEVLRLTGGEGVDIVLNSLAGEAITKSLSLLRPFGRFLEIGKRDIYQNASLNLGLLRNSISFTAVDIAQRWQSDPELIGSILRDVFAAMTQEESHLRPLPVRVFGAEAVEDAFRFMAQAKQIGKVVVSMKGRDVSIEPPTAAGLFGVDGSYLITGGLGALGLAVARWMVGQGARHLILMGRSEPTGAAREAVDALAQDGVQVVTAQADVADLQQVARVVAQSKEKLPPLKGVIHAAGILDDKILLQQDAERFRRVMSPKVSGAWNLHVSTLDEPLEFFVLFSSVAALLGSPGQANYSAANSFLDALAHHRRQLNLPATSINWGPWSEIGLAVRPDRGSRLALRGLGSFTPDRAVEVLEKLLSEQPAQAAVMEFDVRQWGIFNPPAKESSLLSELTRETDAPAKQNAAPSVPSGVMRESVLAVEPHERPAVLETYLRGQLARVLGLAPAKLDSRQPLNRLGLDSLMAVELKNRIELDIGVLIPMVRLLQGPSLAQIAGQLAEQLAQGDAVRPEPVPVAAADPAADLLAKVDEMSDEEVEAMLNNMMITTEGRAS